MSGNSQEMTPRQNWEGAAKGKKGIQFKERSLWVRGKWGGRDVEGYLRGADQGALALGCTFGSYSQKTEVIVLILTK